MSAVVYSCIIAFFQIPEVVMIVFTVLIGSSALDFWYNIKPDAIPTKLYNGAIVYNDGYLLKYSWAQMFSKNKQGKEKAINVVDEKTD